MSHPPCPLNHTATAPIGAEVNGELWTCVEMPGSAGFFGTGRSVRFDAMVDGLALENVGFLATGRGGHMLSLKANVRKKLSKGLGAQVTVTLTRRVT